MRKIKRNSAEQYLRLTSGGCYQVRIPVSDSPKKVPDVISIGLGTDDLAEAKHIKDVIVRTLRALGYHFPQKSHEVDADNITLSG